MSASARRAPLAPARAARTIGSTLWLLATLAGQESAPAPLHVVRGATSSVREFREDVTVLEVALAAPMDADLDLARCTLLRAAGTEVLVLDIDVATMVRTGNTTQNVLLAPGDVFVIPPRAAVDTEAVTLAALLAAVDDKTLRVVERARLLGWRLAVSKDQMVQRRLAAELGRLCGDAAVAVPQLQQALGGPAASEAATSLGLIGAAAAPALPELDRLATSENRAVRACAVAAAARIRASLPRESKEQRQGPGGK